MDASMDVQIIRSIPARCMYLIKRVYARRLPTSFSRGYVRGIRETPACVYVLRADMHAGKTASKRAGEKIHFDPRKAHSWELCFISILCQYARHIMYISRRTV